MEDLDVITRNYLQE